MLFYIPIVIIVVAVIMAVTLRGRWYKFSLLFSALSIASLVYSRTNPSTSTTYMRCYSNIHVCAQNRAAPVVHFTNFVLLSLILAAAALLLSYKKAVETNMSNPHSQILRKTAIIISLIILLGTLAFVVLLFYALSQI